ncbi:MAG: hypothetical protein ACYDGR_08520 [Candidatus Dormibacteria bacterium]
MADGHRVYDRPRVLKLGVRPGARILLVDVPDDGFETEASEMGGAVTSADAPPSVGEFDLVFVGLARRDLLRRVAACKPLLPMAGALWTIRPKASKEISERDVLEAGLATGLVDVKVVSFSPTHSAAKFVHRLAERQT